MSAQFDLPWHVSGTQDKTEIGGFTVVMPGSCTVPEAYFAHKASALLSIAATASYGKLPDPLAAAEGDLLGQMIVALRELQDSVRHYESAKDIHVRSEIDAAAERYLFADMTASALLASAKEGKA